MKRYIASREIDVNRRTARRATRKQCLRAYCWRMHNTTIGVNLSVCVCGVVRTDLVKQRTNTIGKQYGTGPRSFTHLCSFHLEQLPPHLQTENISLLVNSSCWAEDQWLKCKIRGEGTVHSGSPPLSVVVCIS